MKYLPFLGGIYSTAPGLVFMPKAANEQDRLVFQIDDTYQSYLENKQTCRKEDIGKYVAEDRFWQATTAQVNQFLARQMAREHPAVFLFRQHQDRYSLLNLVTDETLEWADDWTRIQNQHYISLFDGLCSQLPEDVAVCQLSQGQDWLAAVHLCAPNHWAAQDKVGKPFDAVHQAVPDMEKTLRHYPKMLETVVQKGPFTRFAWGVATDSRLNHHPQPPPGQDGQGWAGRQLGPDTSGLFVRVERQNLVGLPQVNAFLFTIRTYFYPLSTLDTTEKAALLSAIGSMSPVTRQYKGLAGKEELLRQWLA